MSVNDAYTDVVELCALLQCLGFSVKSLDTSEVNLSQDVGIRTVVINCQSSGLHVVLEGPGMSCSCPATNQQISGVWQVSGVAGGKHLDKVLMATNRPDTLDPALMRPGRLDRKVEFGLPDLEGRAHIFRIHACSMSVERDIRFDLLARLCPNSTGAEIRSVCTEAGMFAIRARRKVATEKDFLEAVNKVIKSYAKFSATPRYMTYN